MANNVGNVGSTKNYYDSYSAATKKSQETENEKNTANNAAANPVDTYTPSKAAKGIDHDTIKKLWNETEQAANTLRKMVSTLLSGGDEASQTFWAARTADLKLSETDRAQAEAMIGEDGFFGVTKTTDRIMNFAKALVGEGASEDKIEEMRSAVQKGFDQAARLFGGFDKLPDVSKQTYDSVMNAFDSWKSTNAAAVVG